VAADGACYIALARRSAPAHRLCNQAAKCRCACDVFSKKRELILRRPSDYQAINNSSAIKASIMLLYYWIVYLTFIQMFMQCCCFTKHPPPARAQYPVRPAGCCPVFAMLWGRVWC
jgi:hypothetical protein